MSKWIEYQPVIDELKHEWCNKCNKTCPYNNCKIYRVMQILRRQKPIPHEPTVKPCNNSDLYFKAMTKEEMKKGGAE